MRRILIPLLLLAACGDPWEGEGVVLDKDYDDPDTWEVWVEDPDTCIDTDYSKYGCQGITIDGGSHREERHDGPHWHLKIETTDENGKTHTHRVTVAEDVYNACRVGQMYSTASEECSAR